MRSSKGNSRDLVFAVTVLAVLSSVCFGYSGGTGEPNNPYLISTAADMCEIGTHTEDWNDCFVLTTDINLIDYNESNFNIIGNTTTYFTGIFDGNGHAISNFTWNSAVSNYVGLFGYVYDPNAEIKNLRLIDPNIHGHEHVGALVGRLHNGRIIDCGIEGGTVSGDVYVGGLVGRNHSKLINCYSNCTVTGAGGEETGGLVGRNHGTLINCYSTGDITGSYRTGGLIGYSTAGTITDCYSTGDVSNGSVVGGLVGNNSTTISNCYASGEVSGGGDIGGLVGYNNGNVSKCFSKGIVTGNQYVGGLVGENRNRVSNSYATSSVSGDSRVGGLAGYNEDTISNSFSTGSVSGNTYVGGLVGREYLMSSVNDSFWDVNSSGQSSSQGGTGKTTIQMQTASTFINAGWDFVEIWDIGENQTYPFLRTYLPSDIDKDKETNFYDLAILALHWLEGD